MKFLIMIPAIALNLTAEPKPRPKPNLLESLPKNASTTCSVYCEFQKEITKIWLETPKNIKSDQTIEMTINDEQAQIDIIKAEIQKVYLRFRKEGKFPENTNIKLPLSIKHAK